MTNETTRFIYEKVFKLYSWSTLKAPTDSISEEEKEQILKELPDRERVIIERRPYETLEELSNYFGVTTSRIRQLEFRAYRRIANRIRELHGLGPKDICTSEEDKKPTTINDLHLSVRAYNCLYRNAIWFLEDLRKLTDDDLLSIRNLGHKTLTEIRLEPMNYDIVNPKIRKDFTLFNEKES